MNASHSPFLTNLLAAPLAFRGTTVANFQFLFGLAFSIPVAVLAPFVTSWIQKYRARRSDRQAAIRRAKIEQEIALVTKYRDDSSLYGTYLMGRILVLTVISAFGTLGSSLFFALGLLGSLAGGAINIIAAVFVIQIGMQTLRVRKKVSQSQRFLADANVELSEFRSPAQPDQP